jgi:hypothetical protein
MRRGAGLPNPSQPAVISNQELTLGCTSHWISK